MDIEISIEENSWNQLDVEAIAHECVDATFTELELNGDNVEICMLFTNHP